MKKQNPLLRLLAPAGPLVLWTAGVLFVTMCLDIAAPLFSQVFADSIITHKHPEWETPMSLLLVLKAGHKTDPDTCVRHSDYDHADTDGIVFSSLILDQFYQCCG